MLTDFIYYDLKVAALLAVFYLFYMLLLARETTHTLNRIVLLSSIVLSVVLPLCIITIHKSLILPPVVEGGIYAQEMVIDDSHVQQVAVLDSLGEEWGAPLLVAVLITGSIIRLFYLLRSYWQLKRIMRHGEKHTLPSGINVCVIDSSIAPFSWMQSIVLSRADWQLQSASILAHEEAHVRHRHSYDIVVVEILTALQWFNPVVWFMRQELRILHEYQADASVLSCGFDESQYIHLLMQKATGIQACVLANGIHTPKTKKRILMMLKTKSRQCAWLKALYILPVVLVSLAMSAETVIDYENATSDDHAVRLFNEKNNGRGESYQIRHQPGVKFFRNGKEEQIPEGHSIALEVSKTTMLVNGKAVEQLTLLDLPAGTLKEIHLTEKAPNQYVCNLMTTKTVKYTSKMSDTEFVVYVKKQQAAGLEQKEVTQTMLNEAGSISRAHILHLNSAYGSKKSYLFVIDGKEVSSEEFRQLPPEAIVSAKVMDVGPAQKAYGEKGRRGATVVKTAQDQSEKSNNNVVYIVNDKKVSEETAGKIEQEDVVGLTTIGGRENVKNALHVDAEEAVIVDTDPVFDVCEQLPQFPGGEIELMKWLAQNMKYPKQATESGVQGRVLVQFIVEKDGSITHPKVIESPKSTFTSMIEVDAYMSDKQRQDAEAHNIGVQALRDEALRVVSAMPKWTPGKQKGKVVRCRFTIPMTYRLN